MNRVENQEIALGQAIGDARRKAGLTQQELCARAGLSYSTLAKIERGAIKTPSVFTVAVIAEFTGTTVEDLTGMGSANHTRQHIDYKTAKNGVKFVYLDVNGVLVHFFHRAFTALALDAGVSPDIIETVFWRYNDKVNRGEMSLNQFNMILAERVGLPNVSWQDYYLASIDPIKEMHDCVRWMAEHYHIGLMSNIMPGFLAEMIKRGLLPDLDYDVVIESSAVKTIKPELKIYEIGATRAGVAKDEILLVDDARANLMAAERLGWHVLWFDDYRPAESADYVRKTLEY